MRMKVHAEVKTPIGHRRSELARARYSIQRKDFAD